QAVSKCGEWPRYLGTALWVGVPALSALILWVRRRQLRVTAGPVGALLLLGAYSSCYHFMYYDFLLSIPAFAALLTLPRVLLEPVWLLPLAAEGRPNRWWRVSCLDWLYWGWNLLPVLTLVPIVIVPKYEAFYDGTWRFPPVDAYCVLGVWLWCAITVLAFGGW